MSSLCYIYHIVHIDRLASIAQSGGLYCDAHMEANHKGAFTNIGNEDVKKRRRSKPIPGTDLTVGDCTPFYFCPRSVMLYVITRHTGTSPYQGSDGDIIHLVVDVREAIRHANESNKRFFITDRNAAIANCQFFHDDQGFSQLDRHAINTWSWKEPETQSKKQAEFMIENHLPWPLVQKIGTKTQETSDKVKEILASVHRRPCVTIEKDWYY